MKRGFNKFISALFAILMMLCIMGGILLMMCECADWSKQLTSLLGGFCLFLLGTVPALIVSRRGERTHDYT